MPSFFRPCILAAMVSMSLIACDDDSTDTDLTELRSATTTETSGRLREVYDPDDLIFVDDLTLNVVVDPVTAPMDISTGVIDGSATVYVEGPFGSPLKIKLKITVLPAGPIAE